jgi:hypothetical protein
MADDRYDQLLQIQQNRQYAAHQRLVSGLESQRQANWQDYCQAISENNMDAAAFAESEYLKHTRELVEMTGGQAAQQRQAQQQQQQAPQPQQGQQQFTPTQQQILERYPGIWNDPKKRAEAINKHDALMQSGYDPDTPAYAHALLVGLGVLDANGQQESNEIASPDTMVEAVRNSKYAKDFTREQYDHLAQYRDALKAHGFYRMDESK